MIKLLFFLTISLSPFLYSAETAVVLDEATPPAEKGIDFFQGSWAEVVAKAKEENKLIFVDAYATWCGPCKWMSRNVFPDNSVGSYFNENFINYKFDMEKGEGPAFARKYGVRAYPTLYFIDGDEKVVHKIVGAKDANSLLSEGRKAVSKKN